MLDHEMPIEEHRLALREQRPLAVQMCPPRLRHRDRRILEEVDQVSDDRRGRNEIRIEHQHEFAFRAFHPGLERARFVTLAVFSVDIGDIEPLFTQRIALGARERRRRVGRVVQHLNLETVVRIVDACCRVDQTLHDEHLVEHRQLDRDDG